MELAKLDSPERIRFRQEAFRKAVLETLGGFPSRTPLEPAITGTLQRDGYRIEKVVFQSLPRFYVTANFYLPAGAGSPVPAVVGVAGHSLTGKSADVYQTGWVNLARRGIAVLALDPPGQGERLEYFDSQTGRSRVGAGTPEHTMAGMQCLLTGSHYARYVLWDAIRAVDYLETRPEIDARRLAVAGNSGGGTQAAYLAAIEPRFKAAVSSCYITQWEPLWKSIGPPDAEQNLGAFVSRGFDFSDFAIASAPRPFLIESAARDYFPIEGARRSYEEARRVFATLKSPGAVAHFVYDDSHGWSKPRREAAYQWLERWLLGRDQPTPELAVSAEPGRNLQCTTTGQVLTEFHGETVRSINHVEAVRLSASRPRLTGGALRSAVLSALKLGLPAGRPSPRTTSAGQLERDGAIVIEKLIVDTEDGIQVPALYFRPRSAARPAPAILYVDSRGKDREAGPGGEVERLAQSGFAVLTIDPRGWGETADVKQVQSYELSYKNFQRALQLNRTVAGMQTLDVIRCLDLLASRPDVDPRRLGIVGKRQGGVLALFAAALDNRVRSVVSDGALLSYLAFTGSDTHKGALEAILPSVLKWFDLPDLTSLTAARTIAIVDPVDAAGKPVEIREARAAYSRNPGVQVTARAEGAASPDVWSGWMKELAAKQ
jgi:cephalosporin-C deacetylase-like acetyl esterase